MSLDTLRGQLPEFAKDIKLNLAKVLSEEGAPGLTQQQIFAIALASSYAVKEETIITAINKEASAILSSSYTDAAKAAAVIMGMNNIYYRFIHLISDKEYSSLPANLRMNVIGNPGIEKKDFELMSLAVSAINGCGMCMEAHVKTVEKEGVSKQGIQSAIRIAAVIHATAQAVIIQNNIAKAF